MPGCLRVSRVPAEATYPLRRAALRPRLRLADMAMAGDDDPATVYLAVLGGADDILSTLRLQPVACPWFPGRSDAWQLRSMATAEHARGLGHGAALVAAAVSRIAEQGGGLLWCNARVPAESFYVRAGFTPTEDRWDDPEFGPHLGMVREVPVS